MLVTMGHRRASSKPSSWHTTLVSCAVVLAVLVNQSLGGQPEAQLANANNDDEPMLDQFWTFPVGRAGYPLNDPPPGVPAPAQHGATAPPGGATFYPGPIPGTVQVGYFSGPSIASSFPPGSYGFNGNGVFGFNIPANALVQQQPTNQQSNWGSGFWSRFNPANRVAGLFNFPQRQPVHQYQLSASITNTPNNRPQNNPQSAPTSPQPQPHPYYFNPPQSDYKPWYNPAGFLPFGNPYFFSQPNLPFSVSDQSNPGSGGSGGSGNPSKPVYPLKPSIPVYNTPNVPNSNGGDESSNSTSDNPSSPPIRTVSPSENTRHGFWSDNLRRNWLQVPWIANLANRDSAPRTDYPGPAFFSLQR